MQRLGAAHPDVPQAFLEQHGRDGGGGDLGKRGNLLGGQGHRKDRLRWESLLAHLAGKRPCVKGRPINPAYRWRVVYFIEVTRTISQTEIDLGMRRASLRGETPGRPSPQRQPSPASCRAAIAPLRWSIPATSTMAPTAACSHSTTR